ncbi:GH36-type glycosyl hydrolase domain-containing protein [Lonsdalea quercina]|uniref:GH36-type glycosyl hydrolase domain-containing protein n=1 Tax=Lonsdalea quercina TaxID=71657 RepID=UPI003976378F
MNKNFLAWFKSEPRPTFPVKGPMLKPGEHPDTTIKAELFSADQMERYGRKLARSHKLTQENAPYYLLKNLAEHETVLTRSCDVINASDKTAITPAGEWLLDNFYLIEEHIRAVFQHLPKNFGKGLPQLGAPFNGPRIYDIATEAIAHGDGRFDAKTLMRYISAYQEITPLTLSELWALPAMLRLAIIDNLRRVSVKVATAQQERNLADAWVDKFLEGAEIDPSNLIIIIADMARSNPPRSNSFVAEMVRRLRGHGNMLALPLTWVEQRLAEEGLTTDAMIHRFNQQQAINQLSVSNSIASLRQLSETNWPDFAESMSLVEQRLLQDPAGIYAAMHFDTRDYYRHTIEILSRQCPYSEIEVADAVLAMAKAAPEGGRKRHVGYYLVDKGRAALEQQLQVHYPPFTRLRHWFNQEPLLSWLGSLSLLTTALSADLLLRTHEAGIGWTLWLMAIPAVIVFSQLVLDLLGDATLQTRTPSPLPRLDFSTGIPSDSRTLVVIPCLLSSRASVDKLINSLEVCYLSNVSPNLYFALLTDFPDSATQTQPWHDELLAYASQHIHRLNQRYANPVDALFFLLHRDPQWNEKQGVWMGYERKRGKLQAVNRWLRQQSHEFDTVVGNQRQALDDIKYVITLDSDTVLPRDAAHKMVGAMAHPLNQPVFDVDKGRVVAGYGILQPRLAEEIPRYGQSRYAALSSAIPGNDPYSFMASDIYQDLFSEGSFVGKGIYDVDTFSRANEGSCPENLVLSHDLLEGCYARSGLLSDVLLYEQYPTCYLADMARRTRWVRGDWQLLNWLGFYVRREDRRRVANPLSGLSRWKLLDNLRRSLYSPSLLIVLFYALTWAPNPANWLTAVAMVLLLPTVLTLIYQLIRKNRRRTFSQHLRTVFNTALQRLMRVGMNLSTLPYESVNTLRAIGVTLWRLAISKRHLQDWVSLDAGLGHHLLRRVNAPQQYYLVMWANPVAAVLLMALTAYLNPLLQVVSVPLGVLWLLSPRLLCWLSREPQRKKAGLTDDQRRRLREHSREIWLFFETFVTAEENWLPPDNFQEEPGPIIARRTSPTNIGLALLANLTAWDFGYVSQASVINRTSLTLDTLDKMAHFRGHLYNWYSTDTLTPLAPRYISSVDSGNLAGHLLTLRSGLVAMRTQPVMDVNRILAGLDDTLSLLERVWTRAPCVLNQLRKKWASAHEAPLFRFDAELQAMLGLSHALAELAAAESHVIRQWAESLDAQISGISQEWSQLLGWMTEEDRAVTTLPSLVWLAQYTPSVTTAHAIAMSSAIELARQRLSILSELEQRLSDHANMDFRFLYNPVTHLLSVGYNCDANVMDSSSYDLLPSEVRLTNFVAVSANQLPTKSWYALGRLFTVIDNEPALMSWSGSMFEYLMPQLVMPDYPGTLLELMSQSAVNRQMAWGKIRGVPWGISESSYYAFDANRNYQYHAFGVPGLGLRRGLGDDTVVAPYATLLALMINPAKACENLATLENNGARGNYGFYEALDYTTSRLAQGQFYAIIRSYMAHHQGMGLLALSHVLLDAPMVERFASNPMFQSARLLLQERMSEVVEMYRPRRHFESHEGVLKPAKYDIREFSDVDSPIPEVQLLSNADYHLMLTQGGGGYSRWRDLALTRWRQDSTCDNRGSFCYLKDTATGEVWSNTWQPVAGQEGQHRIVFTDAGAEFIRVNGSLTVHTHVVVSPEDDIELRRLTLVHRGRQPRSIEITSYAEVVLASAANDLAHPAFSNLFVQTELLPEQDAILCHRRPREPEEACPWLFHTMVVHGHNSGATSFETDRAAFIGRGRNSATPLALERDGALANSAGGVLDPIMAVRQRIQLEPGIPVVVDLVYGITEARDPTIALLEKYRDRNIADRVFELARSHSQIVLRQLNANEDDASLFNRLAGGVLFPTQELRADAQTIMANRRGQSGLWGNAISGDLPIVLLSVSSSVNIGLVATLVQAHSYWRMKGLPVDLVIINADLGGYQQDLQNQILGLISAGDASSQLDKPGGIFVRGDIHMSHEDRILLMSAATIVLDDRGESVIEQLNQRMQNTLLLQKPLIPISPALPDRHTPFTPDVSQLQFFNGMGGFSEEGREYHIVLNEGENTPAPWSNVIANREFGTVVSESGQAYTWYENAHEYRLTPWENDPVSDASGEAFYLRDEESGHVWSPMALPVRGRGAYLTRHGFGYSVFEHRESGIDSELTVFVAEDAPVKLFILTLTNKSGRPRKLSATGYAEWVLGDLRSKSAMHIVTQGTPVERGCSILAKNYYTGNGSERTAFFAVTGAHCSICGDRREFLGRNGSRMVPAALKLRRLSDRSGAGFDPCGAVQSALALIDGDQHTLIFTLGVGQDTAQAEALMQQYLGETRARSELERVQQYWRAIVGKMQITTPDPATNLLANGWLLYQTLACRINARSGYYQSGGAFGFRDQLQDSLALTHIAPERMREQILLCASRQFIEGDVQHWWHPPLGNGVRTRCSDDYLWLPLAICHYVEVTGDIAVLDQPVPYLEGRLLNPGEESSYEQPGISSTIETLWQHGERAIANGLRMGQHGLPLMGCGDWNDGMNLVGLQGRGESVWLGFFLYTVLQRYARLAETRGLAEKADFYRDNAATLKENLNTHAWDGDWYRRGYFDNGEMLGSHTSEECKIDAIAQSWSVLSGAGDEAYRQKAMKALDEQLIDDASGIIKLLMPPFDGDGPNPGYIRGYLPGVRENGGQYTHGAIWAVMAFAEMGNTERAWELMSMINPINHSLEPASAQRYKVEPYVICADIYAVNPHNGRGGWSWYTGSAGWSYRLITESLLGITRHGDSLSVAPHLPAHWSQLEIRYQEGGSQYVITVKRGEHEDRMTLDGQGVSHGLIPLRDDGGLHQVEVWVSGEASVGR